MPAKKARPKTQKRKAPSKKTTATKYEEGRVTLNVEDIKVDVEPAVVASMMSALIHIPSYRKRFEENPTSHLKEIGINVPKQVADGITKRSIQNTLDELTEGSEADLRRSSAAIPGVLVLVRVGTSPGIRAGTSPGTLPGVQVGTRVATGTSTFSAVIDPSLAEKPARGLSQRQQSQRAKKRKRPKK